MTKTSLFSMIKYIITTSAILLGLSGCGEKADPATVEQSDTPIMQVSDQFEVRKSEWKCDEQLSEAQILQVDGFRLFYHDASVDWEEQKNVVGGSAMLVGDTVYSVCLEHDHDKTELELHMHKMTQDDSETFVTTLHHEEGQELMNAQCLPGGRAVVLLVTRETVEDKKLITCCEALILDEVGECVKQFDVTDAFIQSGMLKDGMLVGSYFCDREGYLYVLEEYDVSNVLHVIDTEGKVLADTSQYVGTIHQPALDEEGEYFFLLKGAETGNSIFWFDKGNKEFRQKPVLEKPVITQLLGIYHNYLYYLSNDSMILWNLETGERKKILSLEQLGIKRLDTISWYTDYKIGVGTGGKLLFMNNKEKNLAILAEELTPKEQLSVTSLLKDTGVDLNAATARISREMEQYHVSYTEMDVSGEDYRTRVIADMVAGNGADVLFVSEQDMWILHEKGLISDINEFLTEELLLKLKPNALSMGERSEGMWGIPLGLEVSTVFVQNYIWKGDSWTIGELLELVEAWPEEYLLNIMQAPANVAVLLEALVKNGLDGSDFVDLENGISRFDSPEFIKVLELCMQYAENKMPYEYNVDSIISMVKNGEYMGVIMKQSGIKSLMHMYLQYGDILHAVGHPSEKGNGHYLTCRGMLVVNKNCKSKEAVKEYLEGIVSKKIQNILSESDIPLRNDMGMEQKDFEDEKEYEAYLKTEELISRCVPFNNRYAKIKDMISEECMPYFYGERTAQETAKIINNRVQLYLDEQK